jgi:DNA-binding FadR family transcriptional regulator
MQARVFSYVLAEDADCYTAADLAEGLGVSRAAISSATRALVRAGLLERSREPGARVDTYCVNDDDVWDTINRQRMPIVHRYLEVLDEGVRLVGPETRGGRRLLETRAYLAFFADEVERFSAAWRRRKPELIAEAARKARGGSARRKRSSS